MRDGHRNDCKSCNLAAKRARVARDPQANRDRVREWQKANRERVNAASRVRRRRPEAKRVQRDGYLRRTYGITVDQYDEMLRNQGGVCGIVAATRTQRSLFMSITIIRPVGSAA